MKDTMTIYPETVLTLMYGILGRLKDMGGMYGDLRTIGIQLKETDLGALNHVDIDYDMPKGAQWEDRVPTDSIRLNFYPLDGGEPVVLCDVAGGFPRECVKGPFTFASEPTYNTETLRVIQDARKGIGLSGPYKSVEELMADLNSDL